MRLIASRCTNAGLPGLTMNACPLGQYRLDWSGVTIAVRRRCGTGIRFQVIGMKGFSDAQSCLSRDACGGLHAAVICFSRTALTRGARWRYRDHIDRGRMRNRLAPRSLWRLPTQRRRSTPSRILRSAWHRSQSRRRPSRRCHHLSSRVSFGTSIECLLAKLSREITSSSGRHDSPCGPLANSGFG